MSARAVTEHVFRIPLRTVNVFVIAWPQTLTLVDAGTRGSFTHIAGAIGQMGRRPEEITDIVVTHLHADHTGGLAEMREATGARVWMHPADAALVGVGEASRLWKPAPRSLIGLLARPFVARGPASIDPVPVDEEVVDRQQIPVAGGLLPVWTPGHTAGHVVYLWPNDGGVLFVGDAAANILRPAPSPIYEDYPRGVESLRTLSGLDFEVACFSHGRPITRGAARAFAKRWAPNSRP